MKSLVSLALIFAAVTTQAEVVLYTDRPTARIQPAADEFKARTGQDVVILEMAYPDIKKKLEADKAAGAPSADLIFTKDMVYLAELVEAGAFQKNPSATVAAATDPQLKDKNDLWVGVTFRARSLVYNNASVNPADINEYTDLADPKWAGKICVRTGRHGYNEALVSSFINNLGVDGATKLVQGLVENLSVAPMKSDNMVIEAIASGTCEIGITNSYYLAGFEAKNANFPVKMKFLNQNTSGTHINGSGIGIAATSKQVDLAASFIEILLEEKFQLQMSSEHLDYPAKKGLLPNTFVKDWGTFKKDAADWTELGTLAPKAREIMTEVGYN